MTENVAGKTYAIRVGSEDKAALIALANGAPLLHLVSSIVLREVDAALNGRSRLKLRMSPARPPMKGGKVWMRLAHDEWWKWARAAARRHTTQQTFAYSALRAAIAAAARR